MTTPEVDHEQLQRSLAEHVHGYSVILHNDDVNSMEHVVDALLKSVPTLSEQDAVRVMMDAHTRSTERVPLSPTATAELCLVRLQAFARGAPVEATWRESSGARHTRRGQRPEGAFRTGTPSERRAFVGWC